MFVLQTDPIDTLSYRHSQSSSINGAVTTFEGIVRSDKHQNKIVASLLYIADEPACRLEGETIITECMKNFCVSRAVCIQRIGQVSAGETAIWIGIWSPHRDDAFKACRYMIEEIKNRLLIWKKEYFTDGTSQWVHGCHTTINL
jgi:molybdopterin synthase catalytic subunit